ncbi:hypothetical protein ACJBSK_10120 [Streptococcus suis]|uniref:hypothetical protein n=1 Tax=Streptococcus suis TaxID=1307 RepID=UPI001EE9AA93|nr:hypothetical protein [Streptococcus suis]MBS8026742.1 hypothetical protein [Streptococcus suis]
MVTDIGNLQKLQEKATEIEYERTVKLKNYLSSLSNNENERRKNLFDLQSRAVRSDLEERRQLLEYEFEKEKKEAIDQIRKNMKISMNSELRMQKKKIKYTKI